MALTDRSIKNATKRDKPYKLTDAKGLYLEVRPTGTKLWRYRYRINEKENVFAMGEYCGPINDETAEQAEERRSARRFSLEEARQERIRARDLVKQGKHPAERRDALTARRKAEGANTFKAVAAEWFERNRSKWTSAYHENVRRLLEREVYPDIGDKPIRELRASDVRPILDRLVARGAKVTAVNVRQHCGAIFSYATITERADGDPTSALRRYIERPDVVHKKPLTKNDIPDLFRRIETAGYVATRIAINLLLYLFVRPGELRRAEWAEFDLERAEWVIPAEKMKKREQHVVPLSPQAVGLLRELHRTTGTRAHLFPNHRDPRRCMAPSSLNTALCRLGYDDFSAHGFRATAHTLLAEMGFDERIIEIQLAHKERDKTKASYNQYAYIKERRAMVEQYANLIDSLKTGKVVPIDRAA